MKKLSAYGVAALLTATALGAHAQSNVTIYGLIDLSLSSTKPIGGSSQTGIESGKFSASYYGFRGSEDLGGGLSAVFKLESYVRADTGALGRRDGDALFARTASVGLSSSRMGTLTLGRNATPLFVATVSFTPFGDSFGYSPGARHYFGGGVVVTGDTCWDDSVLYASPEVNGVKLGLIAATKSGANGDSNGGNWGANAAYARGPLAAALIYQDVKKDGAKSLDDTTTWQLNGAYDFGVAKTFLQLGQVKNNTNNVTFRLADVSAKMPLGSGHVLLQYGRLSPDVGNKTKTVSVGYSHTMSKRTELYAAAMHDKRDSFAAGSSYSLGVRHRF